MKRRTCFFKRLIEADVDYVSADLDHLFFYRFFHVVKTGVGIRYCNIPSYRRIIHTSTLGNKIRSHLLRDCAIVFDSNPSFG